MIISNRFVSLDYLRVLAATAVIFSHSYALSKFPEAEPLIYIFTAIDVSSIAVNFFFFLSGYLMLSASARTKNALHFLVNRFSRIFPGVALSVALAVFFALFVTDLNIYEYLSSLETIKYFKNAIFLFNPYLPGVFVNNPYPLVVNGSLWTISYEVLCYLILTLFIFCFRKVMIYVMSALMLACFYLLAVSNPAEISFFNHFFRLFFFFACGFLFADFFKRKVFSMSS